MKILKFGGTSLRARGLAHIVSIILKQHSSSENIIVVVSALEKVTDTLANLGQSAVENPQYGAELFAKLKEDHLRIAQESLTKNKQRALEEIETVFAELEKLLQGITLVRDLSARTRDHLLSFGERLSVILLAALVSEKSSSVRIGDARLFLKTDGNFGDAKILDKESTTAIREFFENSAEITIVPGFISTSLRDEITTLGRGGSDLTATFLAQALQASEVEIWTHVDGFLTSDPKKVTAALCIPELTYEEARELAHYGARLIRPFALLPVMKAKIPVRIKNTLAPEKPGSRICSSTTPPQFAVTGISSVSEVVVLRLEVNGELDGSEVSQRFFQALAQEHVCVLLISQASSEQSLCVALHSAQKEKAQSALRREFTEELSSGAADLSLEEERAVVAVVSSHMRHRAGISGKVFSALGKNGINVFAAAQGSSERNISVVVSLADEEKALRCLHDVFFLGDAKTVHLFLVGTGLVGQQLLHQLAAHQKALLENRLLDIRLVGIANSKQMLIRSDGIALSSAKDELEKQPPAALQDFTSTLLAMNLPNAIFVDCTASEDVPRMYEKLLAAAVSVVTPNKKANSGSLAQYRKLQSAARAANVKFFYETNVGAGLPVIGTLQDLIASGDRIRTIEAVLSGTLSFIFNTFSGTKPFSAVVREAKERGYTEPDPRDDLNGKDVARKLLILGREMGLPLEESDLAITPFLDEQCMRASSVDNFFKELLRLDAVLEKERADAERAGKVLRYIATIIGGRARIALEAVDKNHPFFALSGSDNVISFTTDRYLERPLVVKGPGAGREVTAAGVLADIVRAASYIM